MFESLSNRIKGSLSQLKAKGKIREGDINDTVRRIKLSLLEGDVHFKVVQQFIAGVQERVVGMAKLPTFNAEEQFTAAIQKELLNILGEPPELDFSTTLLVGLQGTGKTTTAAKLAYWLKKQKASPLLVPADVHRPAAIDQLKTLGKNNDLPVFDSPTGKKAVKICKLALKQHGNASKNYPIIFDTAGRLQIDDELMAEIKDITKITKPSATLLVVDAMTGQQALNVATAFNDALGIQAVILSKIEGDARGGAALSIRAVTGIPIAFLGTGEGMKDLEVFDANRIANRILGLGDLSGLVARFEDAIDKESFSEIEKASSIKDFTLESFLTQLKLLKKLGPMQGLLGMLPGFSKLAGKFDMNSVDSELRRFEAMLLSMTPQERRDHRVINARRKRRIAGGSGTRVDEINRFLKRYDEMRKMMKKLGPQGLAGLLGR